MRRHNPAFDYDFNEELRGVVTAAGTLRIPFKNDSRLIFTVSQATLEMSTAPVGAIAELRYQGALVAPAFSAKKAALGGDPPVVLRPGETLSVDWTGCTPGDVGRALFIYRRSDY